MAKEQGRSASATEVVIVPRGNPYRPSGDLTMKLSNGNTVHVVERRSFERALQAAKEASSGPRK